MISFYSVTNNFIYKANSSRVEIGEDIITFESYNKKKSYRISQLKSFRTNGMTSTKKVYIRLRDMDNNRGRYWIHTRSFDNGDELYNELMKIEEEKHPNSLKARARMESSIRDKGEKESDNVQG